MVEKNIIILRGVSGAGKSSLANLLCFNRVGWVSVEADDFFFDFSGNYTFDASKLGAAHNWCQKRFDEFLKEPSVQTIVVANTNTSPREFKYYEDEAIKRGINITYLVIEGRHGNPSVHDVPEQTLAKQEERLRGSIKLR